MWGGGGVSNVFLTYFDYFFGGHFKHGGVITNILEGREASGGTPRQIEHCHIKIAPAGGRWAPLDPLASWAPQPQVRPWQAGEAAAAVKLTN